jgi:phosphatidate cytidylyltransferase
MPAPRRPPPRQQRPRSPSQGSRTTTRGRATRGQPRERRQGSDLLARILVAVPAAILAIIFIDLGGLAFALFMVAIGLVCMHELYRALVRWRPLPVVGFASLAAMVIAARYGGQRDVMEIAVATVPVLFLFTLARGGTGRVTITIAGTLLGVYWLGFAFAHAVLLRELPHGNAVIIDVLVGTFLGDTAAYAGGRLFGRRPLAPQISPNKTVEGLFCGMLIAIVSVFLAGLNQTWLTQGDALLLGVAVAVLGPIGDLFESVIKRDAGIKDTGTAFGAHGGALDRLDAVSFTIVAGYYIWVAVMH